MRDLPEQTEMQTKPESISTGEQLQPSQTEMQQFKPIGGNSSLSEKFLPDLIISQTPEEEAGRRNREQREKNRQDREDSGAPPQKPELNPEAKAGTLPSGPGVFSGPENSMKAGASLGQNSLSQGVERAATNGTSK